MWITIRSPRLPLSPRMLRTIEQSVRRTFAREAGLLGSIILAIAPEKLPGGETGFGCRLQAWSDDLGLLVVTGSGKTLRTAVQQTSLRARRTARRRLNKLRSRSHSMRMRGTFIKR